MHTYTEYVLTRICTHGICEYLLFNHYSSVRPSNQDIKDYEQETIGNEEVMPLHVRPSNQDLIPKTESSERDITNTRPLFILDIW